MGICGVPYVTTERDREVVLILNVKRTSHFGEYRTEGISVNHWNLEKKLKKQSKGSDST